jgi:hypothetical protein
MCVYVCLYIHILRLQESEPGGHAALTYLGRTECVTEETFEAWSKVIAGVCMHVCVYVCMYVVLSMSHMRHLRPSQKSWQVCVCMCVYICMYVCMYVVCGQDAEVAAKTKPSCLAQNIWTWIHSYIYTYIIYVYTYMDSAAKKKLQKHMDMHPLIHIRHICIHIHT